MVPFARVFGTLRPVLRSEGLSPRTPINSESEPSMTRVFLLLAVVGLGLGTLSGCSNDKPTAGGTVVGTAAGAQPVSTLKGTGRLPKGPP
jgi:hypothetical protein